MYWPLTKGTVLPTMIEAGSLSSVRMFGVERMLAPSLACSARASTFRLSTSPTPGRLMVPSTTPMFRPRGMASMVVRALALRPAPPKLVPPRTRPLLPPAIHWMPSSAASRSVTSTIRLSTSTCARRWSSRSITLRRLRYIGSGAAMMSVLVVTSACTVTPPLENAADALPVPPAAPCAWPLAPPAAPRRPPNFPAVLPVAPPDVG
ncbi:hypothetical protein D3C86_1307240 [compost metagenome]